jgi:hypothetical protein
MKTFLAALLAVLAAAADAPNGKFDDFGITFDHPKEWAVKTNTRIKGEKTVSAFGDKGPGVTITLLDGKEDPKQQGELIDKALKETYKGAVIKDSEKPAKRKLLGADREGQEFVFELKNRPGVKTKVEYYAFQTPSKKYTVSVTLQSDVMDADGKKGLETIADSLAEKK